MIVIKSFLLMLVLSVLNSITTHAYTKDDANRVAASDGSLVDTQAAINYVASRGEDGWLLTVGAPRGKYNWNAELTINMRQTFTIKGAGTYTPDTRPTIVFTHSQSSGIELSVTKGKLIRISNFRFEDTGSPLASIHVSGGSDSPSWRVDHCRFENIADRAIVVLGANETTGQGIGPYGLVDNCWFESTGAAFRGLYLYFSNDSNSWRTPHSFGTDKTIVIEDSVFNRTQSPVPGLPAIDSAYNGVRWLMRHCTLNNWVVVVHGADSAPTSTLQFEFNHNTVRVDDAVDYALYIRGGTGVATGNDIGIIGNPNNAGYNSAWKMVRDGPCANGYPCFQQVGRGVVNGAEGPVALYFWNNIYDLGNGANGAIWSNEDSTNIKINRDFFIDIPKPGYTELAYPHPLRNSLPLPPLAPPVDLKLVDQ